MSDKPRTAETTSAYVDRILGDTYDDSRNMSVHYTIGQNYGGEARRQVKDFRRRAPRGGRGRRGSNQRRRRPFLRWLRGVKGCMVCGKEGHLANQRQSEDEVKEAVRKLKEKQSTAMLTGEDLPLFFETFDGDDALYAGDDGGDGEDVNADEEEENEESDIVYMAEEDMAEIQATMTKVAFLHGRTIQAKRNTMIAAMYTSISPRDSTKFEGVKIDTARWTNTMHTATRLNSVLKSSCRIVA